MEYKQNDDDDYDDDPIHYGGQYKQFINRLLISNYFYNSTFFKQANLIYKGGKISKNNNNNQTTHFHGFCKGIEFLSKFRKNLKLSDYNEDILFNPDKITCFDHCMCNFQDQEIFEISFSSHTNGKTLVYSLLHIINLW